MTLINKCLTALTLIALPLTGFSQIHERSMMKNRTDVETESSDYTLGIFKDTAQYRQKLIEFAAF